MLPKISNSHGIFAGNAVRIGQAMQSIQLHNQTCKTQKKVTVILTGKSGSASHKEQFPPMTIEITVLYCQIKNKQIEHNSLERCVLIQYIQRQKLLLLRLNECSQENQENTYNTRSKNKSIHRNINDLESETHYLFQLQLVATT